ncbi:MAG TPA: UDP-3-O-acyl-N-acetylglucosamine deacetylase [Candidatus Megaira endosymbiont of Nemacystus decipiens]|nr:UDP-3-O-acyl-N-acetylglucosamine deacetylase [Candidatus Megaera endosymbiont of Nemacystus decipiens]
MLQTTISKPVLCSGVGVHSGVKTNVVFKPALPETGVVFVRNGVTASDNKIRALYTNVCDTTLSTSIKNSSGVKVSTIEHIMAAIWGCGIDNLIVEIDNAEAPIMDGSSIEFVSILQKAGLTTQGVNKRKLKLLKPLNIKDGGSEIFLTPSQHLDVSVRIDFDNKAIGQQEYSCDSKSMFLSDIANARTFGFLKDLDYLKQRGLARAASLDNTIGIDGDEVMNPDGLRHNNEFARHKLLDLIGDFFCCGSDFIMQVRGNKTSHNINNIALHKIFENPANYSILQ